MANNAQKSQSKRPFVLVLGGMAIGSILAAVLPKTDREEKLLGKVGKEMRKRGKQAAQAAKDAGLAHLDNLGLNRETAGQQLKDVTAKVLKAASAAATAAADGARKK